MAAAVLVTSSAMLLGAAGAHAEKAGFVWNSDPSASGTITPDSAYSYNSAGGTVSITHNATGSYTVTFGSLGDALDSNVEVTGYGTSSNFCQSNGWFSSNGTDVSADVLCFTAAGVAVDNSFTLLYEARYTTDPVPDEAFVWADQPTATSYTPSTTYQYDSNATNRTSAITISRFSPGSYSVLMPGFGNKGLSLMVTAYGSTPAHCGVQSWSHNANGAFVDVTCTDVSGVLTDSLFNLAYTQFLMPGYSTTGSLATESISGGAIWANMPTSATQYTLTNNFIIGIDGEPMIAQEISTGLYDWGMDVEPQWTSSIVLAVAYGSPGSYCNAREWLTSGNSTNVYVDCFNAKGHPAAKRFLSIFEIAGN